MKFYQAIASTLEACRNCVARDNQEWIDWHEDCLSPLADKLPNGAGIDCGTAIDWKESNDKRFVLQSSFHHMDNSGYTYWTEHTIRVYPDWEGIRLTITGRDVNDIKDYLYELYQDVLTQELEGE